MSMPRAATSVHTRKRMLPSRVAAMTFSRSLCAMSPFSHSALKPAFCSSVATRSVSTLVLQKMMALSGSSTSMMRTRSRVRAMPDTMNVKCSMPSAPTASPLSVMNSGFFMWRSATRCTGPSTVAEKSSV